MRILHTSDWHLGRNLHGVDLKPAQADVLDQIVQIARQEQVDAVLVSGDVYDQAMPPIDAVRQLQRTIGELASFTTVIISSGNHDSVVRLGFGSRLFMDRIHIRTELDRIAEPVVLTDEYGPVLVYPVPYLDPRSVARAIDAGETVAPTHEAVLGWALDQVRADLADRDPEQAARSVVMAHAFVGGHAPSQCCASERDIAVGGVDRVPVEVFDGIGYVALGHLHGQQDPGGAARSIRYSGSPLRYSFSERNQAKSVTIVDIGPDGVKSISLAPLTQPRQMAEIRGPLSLLCADPALEAHADAWVRAVVTDPIRPERMHPQLRARFPHLINVEHEPSGGTRPVRGPGRAEAVDVMAVLGRFLADASGAETGDETGAEQDLALVRAAYEELRLAEVAA